MFDDRKGRRMRVYYEKNDGGVSRGNSLDGIALDDCRLLWIDMEDPPGEEVELAGAFVGAHPVALNTVIREGALPKLQEFGDHLFLTWYFARDRGGDGGPETSTLFAFLGRNFLLTIHREALAGLDDVWNKLEADSELYRHQPALALYAVLDNSVDEYFPIVEDIANSIDSYQDLLMSGQAPRGLETVIAQKHRNMSMRRLVTMHHDVILKLGRRDTPFIPGEISVYMMDVYDLLVRVASEIDTNADLITASMDIHLNVVSNRLNEVMKKLTIVATIFLPLTFLTGLFGMNFKYMPELGWRYGYLMAWIAFFVIAVITYFLARWFIERPPRRKRRPKEEA